MELDDGSRALGDAALRDFGNWFAALVFLHEYFALAVDLGLDPVAERRDGFCPNAVQSGRRLVRALVELGAGADRGHNDFERRPLGLGMLLDWYATAVVADADAAVHADLDVDV